MSNPTADWERVGDRFYRKIKLYDAVFDQDLELENYVIAGAPYAGAIGSLSQSSHGKPKADALQPCTETKTSCIRTVDRKPPSLVSIYTAVPGSLYGESTWVALS